MKALGRFLIYLVCLPTDLPCWLLLAALRWLGGRRFVTRDGVLGVELRERSLVQRAIRRLWPAWGAITIAPHAMVFAQDTAEDAELWAHELVHTEQAEGMSVLGTVLAAQAVSAGAAWWLAMVLLLTPLTAYFAASTAAALRGRHVYRDNINERAARAIAAFRVEP